MEGQVGVGPGGGTPPPLNETTPCVEPWGYLPGRKSCFGNRSNAGVPCDRNQFVRRLAQNIPDQAIFFKTDRKRRQKTEIEHSLPFSISNSGVLQGGVVCGQPKSPAGGGGKLFGGHIIWECLLQPPPKEYLCFHWCLPPQAVRILSDVSPTIRNRVILQPSRLEQYLIPPT